ncbi:MAG: 16S rRNA (adenine(1518)-N(6)/adenine(1519)-N(6))-dimethyltransferase RsmA [Phycisphaerales bacterium]
MHTLTQLRELLESRSLAPRKSLGQNFLIDANLAAKLLDASSASNGDLVLEVGPGAGALTEDLLARGCTVIACELDRGMCELLTDRFPEALASNQLTLINDDCLATKRALSPKLLDALASRPFRLVANLPYQAASPLMAILASDHHPAAATPPLPPCLGQYVTIQKEVADRLLSQPNTKSFGPLTVIVRAFASITRIATLPPECFWPRPEVTSAMISITPLPTPVTSNPAALSRLCHLVFTQRRKKLSSILKPPPPHGWPEGVSPDSRAEQLDIPQLAALADSLAE